ncbi:hypothetical protein G6L37_04755 [Agrobacterium rubi]|nr:hypothetical protein [Agrobacterium rubi]NTF24664.1 hypothetical protein [Agrobacterium rubi]
MFEQFQRLMVALAARADDNAVTKAARRISALGGRFMKGPGVMETLAGIGRMARFHEDETSSWVTIDAFRDGACGPFDACDIRHWMHLSDLAGVAYVPGKEVLRLTQDEMSAASGTVPMPDTATTRQAMKNVAVAAEDIARRHAQGKTDQADDEVMATFEMLVPSDADMDDVERKLYDAMDDVPEGWMVRTARVGSSNLKALAGSGHAGHTVPEVKLGPQVEVGPGWIRIGNRRRIAPNDLRTVKAAAEGPVGDTAFLARPWAKAARYFVHDDPNRHETPLKGPGVWPAEWRAFVEDGHVVGVSCYYSWIGEANQENAAIALQVRAEAQKIADKAVELAMWPRFMDLEFVRNSQAPAIRDNSDLQDALDLFGREKVACTLDFIETEDGLKLLEGGPPNTPFGGGHPCGFAGCGGSPRFGNRTDVRGVAFRNMAHVIVGDPKTWDDGDREGCILTWEEVATLVTTPSP